MPEAANGTVAAMFPTPAEMRSVSASLFARRPLALLAAWAVAPLALAQPANPAGIDWQAVGNFSIARSETTIGQFRKFAEATQFVSRAEREGGGEIYEAGWVKKPGWNWKTPFGGTRPAAADEPAAHVTYSEAQAFCRWAGGRLPTDSEWVQAAYTETRNAPPAPFTTGTTYPYPTGENPQGAQCLGDCGPQAQARAINHGAALTRGYGHTRAGSTPAGVNGLFDMGGNLWEWVDEPKSAPDSAERRTRGGSWWYGAAQMQTGYLQSKPGNTAVAYIGFRCVK
jgi:formylglycine-generating enzyme